MGYLLSRSIAFELIDFSVYLPTWWPKVFREEVVSNCKAIVTYVNIGSTLMDFVDCFIGLLRNCISYSRTPTVSWKRTMKNLHVLMMSVICVQWRWSARDGCRCTVLLLLRDCLALAVFGLCKNWNYSLILGRRLVCRSMTDPQMVFSRNFWLPKGKD